MKLYCANGCHDGEGKQPFKTEGFHRQSHETNCPGCGGRLETGEEFHAIVVSLGCWAKDHREGHACAGRVEAHHLLPASWWRKTFGDLPEERLLELMYGAIVGAPLCGAFHAAVTARKKRIHFEELERELIELCERLDREFPGRGVMARLRLECPPQQVCKPKKRSN